MEADKELEEILGDLYYLDEDGGWQTKEIGYQSYEQSKTALLAWQRKAVMVEREKWQNKMIIIDANKFKLKNNGAKDEPSK